MPAISRKFPKTNANSRKFQHDRGIAFSRSASHCVNDTYIAGYADITRITRTAPESPRRRLPTRKIGPARRYDPIHSHLTIQFGLSTRFGETCGAAVPAAQDVVDIKMQAIAPHHKVRGEP